MVERHRSTEVQQMHELEAMTDSMAVTDLLYGGLRRSRERYIPQVDHDFLCSLLAEGEVEMYRQESGGHCCDKYVRSVYNRPYRMVDRHD